MAEKKKKEVNEDQPVEAIATNEESVKQEIPEKSETIQEPESLSSLDLIWQHAFQELDAWVERANCRDEVLLMSARLYAETMKRNKDSIKAIAEQFNKELAEWERTAREELLMSTTTLQHFFPINSYEEINRLLDNIQSRTSEIALAPYRTLTSSEAIDKYVETLEQFILMRQRGRMQYINHVKQTAKIIYENQKGFVSLFTNQLKSIIFPFNKYMEKPEGELTKS